MENTVIEQDPIVEEMEAYFKLLDQMGFDAVFDIPLTGCTPCDKPSLKSGAGFTKLGSLKRGKAG